MAHGKRSRQQAETTSVSLMDLDGGDMARILMIFSGHHNSHGHHGVAGPASPERVFECKTCSRRFPSFQALGGHRASHKKPRLAHGEPPKPKVHGCSICGLEFAVGQALGGHMRRHRAVAAAGAGVERGLSLVRPRDDGKKKTAAVAAELMIDLNVPSLHHAWPAVQQAHDELPAVTPVHADAGNQEPAPPVWGRSCPKRMC